MSKRKLTGGMTSVALPIFIADTSSSTGAGLGSLVYNTSGLVAEYRRQGQSTWTAITLVAGTLGTFVSGGFIADGSLAGSYELCPPNAALATGAKWVRIRIYGATNMLATEMEIEIDAVDYQDAVRFGLTALPNAAAAAANGLITFGSGAGQLNPSSGVLPSVTTAATGTAQLGSSTTIRLALGSSTTTDLFKGNFVVIGSGTGAGQSRVISGYNGSTFDATVSRAWAVNPDSSSTYVIIANPHPAMDASLNVSLAASEHTLISGTDVPAALTAQGYTTARAGYMDVLNGIVTAIWAATTRTLSAFGFTPNVVNVTGTIPNATVGGYASGQDPATLVLDTAASGHNTANSIGNKISSAASAGDPWTATLPGAYGANTAGNIVGNNLNATVASRLATSGYTAPDNADIVTALADVVTLLGRTDPTTALQLITGLLTDTDVTTISSDKLTGTLTVYAPGSTHTSGNILQTISLSRATTNDPFSLDRV